MKGQLHKTEQGWVVKAIAQKRWPENGVGQQVIATLPLHPTDIKQINEDAKVFDNIEARIAAYPDVEFEVVTENVDTGALEAPYIKIDYAKLIPKQNGDKKDDLDEFEKYLDREVEYKLSQKSTIERIKWYYKTYFKSKETLFTEEQVRKAIEDARDILSYVNTDEVIKSLKQRQ